MSGVHLCQSCVALSESCLLAKEVLSTFKIVSKGRFTRAHLTIAQLTKEEQHTLPTPTLLLHLIISTITQRSKSSCLTLRSRIYSFINSELAKVEQSI